MAELPEAELRLKTLENLFSSYGNVADEVFSVETLLDSLLVLYNECTSSSFKREKNVTEFIESGEFNN